MMEQDGLSPASFFACVLAVVLLRQALKRIARWILNLPPQAPTIGRAPSPPSCLLVNPNRLQFNVVLARLEGQTPPHFEA